MYLLNHLSYSIFPTAQLLIEKFTEYNTKIEDAEIK